MVNISNKIIVKLELQNKVNVQDAFQFLEELIGSDDVTNSSYIRSGSLYCIGNKEVFEELFQGKFWYSNTVGKWLALGDLKIPQNLEKYVKEIKVCDY